MNRRSAISVWHLVAPLPATLIGTVVMHSTDIAAGVWLQNLVATALGLVLVVTLWLRGAKRSLSTSSIRCLAVGCVALLGLTLIQLGVEGVQRWISLGASNLHVGALVLPGLLVLLLSLGSRWAAIIAASAAAILCTQPDAAQASAFAIGCVVVSAGKRGSLVLCATAGVILAAVAAVLRGDQLRPVPHVESIVGLVEVLGPIWFGAALVSLALPPIALLVGPRQPATLVLGLYVAATLVAAWIGHFPVPFMGHGVAPILGYYAALGTMLCVDTGQPRATLPKASHSSASTGLLSTDG